jgi:hypothetical protein
MRIEHCTRPIEGSVGYSERYVDGAHDDCHLGKIGVSAGVSGQLGVGRLGGPVANLVVEAEVSNGCDDARAASVVGVVSGKDSASVLDDLCIVALELGAFPVEGQRIDGEVIAAHGIV